MFNLKNATHVKTPSHEQAMFKNYRDSDNVRGILCGDADIKYAAQVFYDGRPQGAKIWGKNDKEIENMANKIVEELIAECDFCYQDKKVWELRVYD